MERTAVRIQLKWDILCRKLKVLCLGGQQE